MINQKIFKFSGFTIKKYIKNIGKFTIHDDFNIQINNDYRIITYLWYLNDVFEGGETDFLDKIKIIPEKGKLIFFPSFWTHPHSALMPISNDKYIITGWILLNDTKI
jgi:Rps23 Pro-64 3,4-dihydroxylase Tpa1-like proline 4-hydroxylase